MADQGEESVYVLLELEGMPLPLPGEALTIEGLDSPAPRLLLPDGTVLVGEFEETLGTQLIFSDDMGAAAAEDGEDGGKRRVELQCHTDKKIRFRKQR